MKKFTKKLSILFASLAMVMGVGLANGSAKDVKAEDYELAKTYDLTNSVPNGLTASESLSKDSTRGMGKAGATYTLTTSDNFTNVVKIVVNAATNYSTFSNHSVSATIGGIEFGTPQNFTAKTSTDYTFDSNPLSGIIVVALTNGKEGTTKTNTIWCKTISIYTKVEAPADASSIIALIDAIGTVEYTDECKAKIDAARAAYDAALDLQSAVSNYATLTAAEAEYAKLEADAKEEADLEAALAFEEMIDALPEAAEIADYSKKAEIDAAVEAYDKLTEDQKYLVSEEAVNKMNALVEAIKKLTPTSITFGSSDDKSVCFDKSPTTYTDELDTSWTFTAECESGTVSFTKNPDYNQIGSKNDKTRSISLIGKVAKNMTITGLSVKFGGFTDTVGNIAIKIGDTEYASGELNSTKDVIVSGYSSVAVKPGDEIAIEVTEIDRGVKLYSIDYFSDDDVVDSFINDWKALRDENGSICNSLNNKANVQLLLDRYDELSEEAKAIVDATIDVEDVTIAESVIYVRNVINGDQSTTNDYGYGLTNTTIKMTGENNSTITLVALLALVGIISVSAYYFIEKKKLAK